MKEIDRPIRNLVVAMNTIPYVTTFCSCAGHKATKEDCSYEYNYRVFVAFELLKEEDAARDFLVRLKGIATIDYPEVYYNLSKRFWSDKEDIFWHKEKIRSEKDNKKRERLEKRLKNEIKNSHSNLIWNYRLDIYGEGNTKKKARERLDAQIKTLEDFFLEESKTETALTGNRDRQANQGTDGLHK